MATLTAMPPVPVWTLRDRIVKAREERGWDQAEFARRARIGRRTVARWENTPNPPRKVAAVYAGITGYPIWWFVGEGWEPDPTELASESTHMPTYADFGARKILVAA